MTKAITLTLENKSQKAALSGADYLTGKSADAPQFKTAAAIAAAVQVVTVSAEAMQAEGNRLSGGMKALALVAALVASKTVSVDGKGLDTWSAVKGWLEGHGTRLSTIDGAHEAAMSELGRVYRGIVFAAAIPDTATVIEQAFTTVRDGLASHGGSFKAWRDASPKSTKAGRKAGKGKGKSTAKAEAAMTAREMLKAIHALRVELAKLAYADMTGEAADGIKAEAEAFTGLVAKLAKAADKAAASKQAKAAKAISAKAKKAA